MKKLIIPILVVAAIIGITLYLKKDSNTQTAGNQTQAESNQNAPAEVTPTPTPISDPNVKTFTMEEVRKHGPESWDNGDSSPLCWMVIRDKVYEIPDNFIETHPGGHVIYEGCGTDATTSFETRPQGSGTPHSSNARNILEKYYIGDLKK